MPARSADTDADAERVQVGLLREAGPTKRAQMALSLSATVISLARRAIRRSLPEASDADRHLRFVELHYGQELASELRRYLASRRP